ncbi:MAG TPA: hypothetical protein PKA28_11500 [Methylomusa anaerophila]|uniref:Uncharacterized protein n=1 Tax=Methylomusa anaerophila TaxID=1930071 RepID=A0A348AJD4_9FIRM|nr:hypothetical protein [Methylomusa anaerophila]BBB91182.1 hypothetical protein MAMMFC1_01853 [Methylomusa anaerophila]HML89059.1 hypothetical protein [Methylomusa anaerophila]
MTAVGEPFMEGKSRLEPIVTYRFDTGGHTLAIIQEGLTEQEIELVNSGKAELALYVDLPVLFLLYRFGGDSCCWLETPFSWHMTEGDKRAYPDESTPEALLNIVLVEAATGIVKVVRRIKLNSLFTAKLHETILAQSKTSFNGQSFAKHLNTVYNEMDVEEMVHAAVARHKE